MDRQVQQKSAPPFAAQGSLSNFKGQEAPVEDTRSARESEQNEHESSSLSSAPTSPVKVRHQDLEAVLDH